MQVGILVTYNVCEVKLDKVNHWICVHREGFLVAMLFLYFNIISQLENPLCVHVPNGSFYQVLLHTHCKQLGSQLAFCELIYVRPVFLN